ncbi:hypothetical protein F0562_002717 [Nyssa sinensis]|uniref:Bulb-type lectin domain-containing protein n=1 Tax=Nyssa sinensis TaxID=561372 RepID=A0A5J5BV88_9ASTE|nr:hypothetical protein F0562_002717 [Nyssa sinensis]
MIIVGATAQQRNSSISLGSSLSPTGSTNWSPDSGHFAFGFYPKGNGFAVGIWYTRTLPQTVVWTANRDDPPLSANSTLLWSSEGKLILQRNQGLDAIAIAPGSASSASILDSGNFVLYNSDSQIIWQSSDSPTDTLLPGQPLLTDQWLISSLSKADHSSGEYKLVMQDDGNLVYYPLDVQNACWSSKTAGAGDNVTLHLDNKGQLYLMALAST